MLIYCYILTAKCQRFMEVTIMSIKLDDVVSIVPDISKKDCNGK